MTVSEQGQTAYRDSPDTEEPLMRERFNDPEFDFEKKQARGASTYAKIRMVLSSHFRDVRDQSWPLSSRWTRACLVVGLVLLGLIGYNWHTQTQLQADKKQQSTLGQGSLHPMEELTEMANKQFSKMLSTQSTSLAAAVTEYERRYGRKPPTGFPQWYNLAKEKGLLLIDEFDVLMENLEPFWGISPKTLRGRIQSRNGGGSGLIDFKSGVITNHTSNYQLDEIMSWMAELPWQTMIQNLTLLVHAMDEPTINAPASTLREALHLAATQKTGKESPPLPDGDEDVSVFNFSKEKSWPYIMDSCDPKDPARRPSTYVPEDPIPFIQNKTEAMDPCLNPYHHEHHGIWNAPANLLLTKHLVPALSQSRPVHFNDVLWPSPFYTMRLHDGGIESADSGDSPWSTKLDRIYWVGTGNGGVSNHENYRRLQRNRMTLLTRPDNPDPVSLLHRDLSTGVTRWVKQATDRAWSQLAPYFHLRIAEFQVCTEGCDWLNEIFHTQKVPMVETFGSKYCLDLDGMGFSGRFHKLLRSNCAVIKQTIFQEWSDGWLVPWVHYMPLTLEGKELGEMARFLMEEPEGRTIGQRIADQGREWSRRTLRREDMQLYFLRLLMEYERLLMDNRNEVYYS